MNYNDKTGISQLRNKSFNVQKNHGEACISQLFVMLLFFGNGILERFRVTNKATVKII